MMKHFWSYNSTYFWLWNTSLCMIVPHLFPCNLRGYSFRLWWMIFTLYLHSQLTAPISLQAVLKALMLPVAFTTVYIIRGFSLSGAPFTNCILMLLVTAAPSRSDPVVRVWATPTWHSKPISSSIVHQVPSDDPDSAGSACAVQTAAHSQWHNIEQYPVYQDHSHSIGEHSPVGFDY